MEKRQLYVRVGWKKYLVNNDNPRVESFLNTNGLIVFTRIMEEIEDAVDEDFSDIMVMIHKNVGSIVCINKSEFLGVLDHAMSWFLKYEHYEQCAKVQKLQEKIKNKSLSKKDK